LSREPAYEWHLAGGPGLVVDVPEPHSRVPHELSQRLKGKDTGLYRITFPGDVPDNVWRGEIPSPVDRVTRVFGDTTIEVSRVALDWRALIERLTFGAYGQILDIHVPADDAAPFWQPLIVRDLGFLTADRRYRRFFRYLELLRHVDEAAWDPRSVWARVKLDVRRDFAYAVGMVGRTGGVIAPSSEPQLLEGMFVDRLAQLDQSITAFESLLIEQTEADEVVFQDFLSENPLLIDVYGEVIAHPRFPYPDEACTNQLPAGSIASTFDSRPRRFFAVSVPGVASASGMDGPPPGRQARPFSGSVPIR
jgi:hypothetical protein